MLLAAGAPYEKVQRFMDKSPNLIFVETSVSTGPKGKVLSVKIKGPAPQRDGDPFSANEVEIPVYFSEDQLAAGGFKIITTQDPVRSFLADTKLIPRGEVTADIAYQTLKDAEIYNWKLLQAVRAIDADVKAKEQRQKALKTLGDIQKQLSN